MTDRLSVLVADDETLIRRKVKMMLSDLFNVDEAADAKSAREAACSGYDAMVLDIVFPDGNGIDICREIKAQDPYVTVIVSSSLESVEAWDNAFRAGADGYLEKRELLALNPKKIAVMIEGLVERNRLRRQAADASRRQSELMSVLSHDVRAPFQALLGTIDLLKRSDIPPDAAKKVDILNDCARDQLAFINSLLELLRLESGMIGLRQAAIDINLPVGQSIQSLGVLARSKGIDIETNLARDLPRIEADLGKIAQVMNNLLSNAIKFSYRGGRIKVSTGRAQYNGDNGVEILVDDEGVGIAAEDEERLLQRFRQGRERGTEGETGTGLGLSICKELVQLHQGAIALESLRPKGTRARIWLPSAGQSDITDHLPNRPSVAAG